VSNPSGTPENLRPFKPGQSGNPGGRPKGRSVTSRLRRLLRKAELPAEGDGKLLLDRIAETIIKKSLEGNHKFVTTLLERTEGKVKATLHVTTAEFGRKQPRDDDGNLIEY
jgi:hypothetical protein